MTNRSKALISLFAAFLLGFALCFLILRLAGPPRGHSQRAKPSPEQFTQSIIDKFTRELSLNEGQIEALREQLQQLRTRYDSLRVQNATCSAQIREQFREEFSKVLTPEQQIRFVEFNKREDEKHWGKR
ncbi:MAG TPA: hypothetical protein PKJ13_04425 [bacterium]|nr:hypothetical protein [bacterium]